jgi:hypothetical protein
MLSAKADDVSSANLDYDHLVVVGKSVGAMPSMSKKI